MLPTELGVAHAFRVLLEVHRLSAEDFRNFEIVRIDRAECTPQLFDFSLVEETALVDLDPGFLFHLVMGI